MCNERPLETKVRAVAIKLRGLRPALDAPEYEAWERKVAEAVGRFALGGGNAHEFCDLAGVP